MWGKRDRCRGKEATIRAQRNPGGIQRQRLQQRIQSYIDDRGHVRRLVGQLCQGIERSQMTDLTLFRCALKGILPVTKFTKFEDWQFEVVFFERVFQDQVLGFKSGVEIFQ